MSELASLPFTFNSCVTPICPFSGKCKACWHAATRSLLLYDNHFTPSTGSSGSRGRFRSPRCSTKTSRPQANKVGHTSCFARHTTIVFCLFQPDVYKSSSMKPTEQQHPRYSGRSLLRCPHDNSHQGHTELRFPAVEPSNEPGQFWRPTEKWEFWGQTLHCRATCYQKGDFCCGVSVHKCVDFVFAEPGTLEEFSILFGDGTIAADKSKPSLGSALGHSMENPAETSKLTQVQKLAAKIRSSFVSPLAQVKFLVHVRWPNMRNVQ